MLIIIINYCCPIFLKTTNNLLIYTELSSNSIKELVYENNTDNQTIEYVYRTLIIINTIKVTKT